MMGTWCICMPHASEAVECHTFYATGLSCIVNDQVVALSATLSFAAVLLVSLRSVLHCHATLLVTAHDYLKVYIT